MAGSNRNMASDGRHADVATSSCGQSFWTCGSVQRGSMVHGAHMVDSVPSHSVRIPPKNGKSLAGLYLHQSSGLNASRSILHGVTRWHSAIHHEEVSSDHSRDVWIFWLASDIIKNSMYTDLQR